MRRSDISEVYREMCQLLVQGGSRMMRLSDIPEVDRHVCRVLVTVGRVSTLDMMRMSDMAEV